MATATQPLKSAVHEVDAATVKQWLDAGQAQLIDVREEDEYAEEHIDGATVLPTSKLTAANLPRAEAGRKLVIQCRSGRRSLHVCQEVVRAGGGESWNLTGGILAWKRAGLPTTKAAATAAACNAGVHLVPVQRQVLTVVGLGVGLGVLLGWLVNPAWLILDAFFAVGLLVAGFSGFCPMAAILAKCPFNRSKA